MTDAWILLVLAVPLIAPTIAAAVAFWILLRPEPAPEPAPAPALPCQPGTPVYRGGLLALDPPHDGALLGYRHPLGWPVRIVRGIPVAVGTDGRAARWSATAVAWVGCEPELAAEARSRLQLEDTRVDESMPVAEPGAVDISDCALLGILKEKGPIRETHPGAFRAAWERNVAGYLMQVALGEQRRPSNGDEA